MESAGPMQIICTLLLTNNHTSTSLNFYRPDALPDAQPTVSKHWKHTTVDKCPGMALVVFTNWPFLL